jgi:hypothetical protein
MILNVISMPYKVGPTKDKDLMKDDDHEKDHE